MHLLETWQKSKNWPGERKEISTPNSHCGSPTIGDFHHSYGKSPKNDSSLQSTCCTYCLAAWLQSHAGPLSANEFPDQLQHNVFRSKQTGTTNAWMWRSSGHKTEKKINYCVSHRSHFEALTDPTFCELKWWAVLLEPWPLEYDWPAKKMDYFFCSFFAGSLFRHLAVLCRQFPSLDNWSVSHRNHTWIFCLYTRCIVPCIGSVCVGPRKMSTTRFSRFGASIKRSSLSGTFLQDGQPGKRNPVKWTVHPATGEQLVPAWINRRFRTETHWGWLFVVEVLQKSPTYSFAGSRHLQTDVSVASPPPS